jgi:hypothetical protein
MPRSDGDTAKVPVSRWFWLARSFTAPCEPSVGALCKPKADALCWPILARRSRNKVRLINSAWALAAREFCTRDASSDFT